MKKAHVPADLTPCINIYVDAAPEALARASGKPIRGVDISGNTIVNAKTAAIGVAYARSVRVADNRIVNPMAAGLQTAMGRVRRYDHPAAILLDCVADTAVCGNRIATPAPELIPNVWPAALPPLCKVQSCCMLVACN